MRFLTSVLLALSATSLVLAAFALTRIWDEHADSPDSAYLGVAAIEVGIALTLGFLGWLAWRSRQ